MSGSNTGLRDQHGRSTNRVIRGCARGFFKSQHQGYSHSSLKFANSASEPTGQSMIRPWRYESSRFIANILAQSQSRDS